jgi:2-oxo-4-hydroxy-4-carboxy-5-ureidoimidazoline decarboxylase
MPDAMPIADLNLLDREAFVSLVGSVFEHSPWIAAEAWDTRPWESLHDLHAAMTKVVGAAATERQLALIRAHPDLVGRAALAGTLTRESTAEQRAAGLDPDTLRPEEIAQFLELNTTYKARFGFPFVICARENRKETILAGLQSRMANDRDREIETALAEIGKITWYRLQDIVPNRESAE